MAYTMLNGAMFRALRQAIEADHPCEDYGCDIHVSLREGFVTASAIMLTGATETPHVIEVLTRYGIDLGNVHDRPFQLWVAWHRKNGRQCPACESYMYAAPGEGFEPATCTNCLAPLDNLRSLPDDELQNRLEKLVDLSLGGPMNMDVHQSRELPLLKAESDRRKQGEKTS